MLARLLGAYGAGVVLQAVAAFTIALSIAKLGLDTTAVWLLPRLMTADRLRVRSAVAAMLAPSAICSLIVALGWFAARNLLPEELLHGAVGDSISVVAVFLPFASVMTVALAATRAFGGVVPFNAIGNLLVPLLRPVGLMVVVLLGGAATAATLSWALPWAVGMVAALFVLSRQIRRSTGRSAWTPSRATMGEISRYSLPRTISSGLEQALLRVDVVVVGAILGSADAGIYGSATRFAAAGLLISTALRIVVAPRFSALLADRNVDGVEQLYSVTAKWILLFGSPIYIVVAVFSPTVLGWLGPGFGAGWSSLTLLCVGCFVFLAGGNVQSLLLMSGRSGWAAANKVVVVAFNLILNLILVPRIGIVGAAVSWSASMVLDTVLAALQVKRDLGIRLAMSAVVSVALMVVVCVGIPSALVAGVLGQGLAQLLLAVGVAGLALAAYCAADRRRLQLNEFFRMRRA